MKIKLPISLAILATLLLPGITRADEKPQLFAAQANATYPWCSPEGTLLAVSDEETNGFTMWDIATKRPLWKSSDYLTAFFSDEKSVVVAHSAQPLENDFSTLQGVSFRLLDARTGRLLKRMGPLPPDTQTDEGSAFLLGGLSVDDSEFIVVTPHYLHIYNARTGDFQASKKWSGLTSPLTCAALLSNKDQMIAYAEGLVILDTRTGALIRRLSPLPPNQPERAEKVPDSLEVSPDDSVFSEDFDDEAPSRLRRLSDGKLLWSALDWPTFSPEGERVYIPATPGLDVFETGTGRKIKHIPGPNEYGFDISPDEKWFYETRNSKIYRWPVR